VEESVVIIYFTTEVNIVKIPDRFNEICNNKKFIYFIHVPSTGGIYLKKTVFLNEPRFTWYGKSFYGKYDHHPCGLTRPVVHQGSRNHSKTYKFDPFFLDIDSLVISTVRNPFDQYVSSYLLTKKDNSSLSFDDFIDITCSSNFSPTIDFGESFYLSRDLLFYQIFDDDGSCHCDLILRRESLNEGLEIILNKLGIDAKLSGNSDTPPGKWGDIRKKQGFSKKRDYRLFYSDRTREIVEKRREKELKLFGYNFDGTDDRVIISPDNISYKLPKDER
jgi:hypothetical protein